MTKRLYFAIYYIITDLLIEWLLTIKKSNSHIYFERLNLIFRHDNNIMLPLEKLVYFIKPCTKYPEISKIS